MIHRSCPGFSPTGDVNFFSRGFLFSIIYLRSSFFLALLPRGDFFFGAEENVNCTREAISSRKNIQIGNFTIVAGEIRNYELPSSRAAIKLRRNQVMCGESNLGA